MDKNYIKIGTPAMRIVEECGEILQAVMKGERFGWNDHHPDRLTTNLQDLESEIGDLCLAFDDLLVQLNKRKDKP